MNWERKALKDIADFQLGKMLDQRKNRGSPRPYLANLNIRWGSFELSDLRTMLFEPDETERYGLRPGDIVMCEGGEPGRCAIWKEQIQGVMFQKAVHRIRANNSIDHRFLYYSFLHKGVTGGFDQHLTGATIKHLPRQDLAKIEITVPPLPIQHGIADVLSAYDDLIEVNTRRITILEEMARRLFEEWFVRFQFPGFEDANFVENGRLPKGWSHVILGSVADLQWGDTTKTKASYVESGFTAYSATGPDGALPYADFDRSGIVLSAIGANCGKTWFATGKWSCIKNTIRFWSICPELSDEYLFLWTQRSDYWPKRGAAQPFISQGDARRCLILKPTTEVSNRFTEAVRPLMGLIILLRKQSGRLAACRDLLLPKLISGEIDVSQAEAKLEAAQ